MKGFVAVIFYFRPYGLCYVIKFTFSCFVLKEKVKFFVYIFIVGIISISGGVKICSI